MSEIPATYKVGNVLYVTIRRPLELRPPPPSVYGNPKGARGNAACHQSARLLAFPAMKAKHRLPTSHRGKYTEPEA